MVGISILEFFFNKILIFIRLKASHKAAEKQQNDTITQLRDQLSKKKDELSEALENQGQVVEIQEVKSTGGSSKTTKAVTQVMTHLAVGAGAFVVSSFVFGS